MSELTKEIFEEAFAEMKEASSLEKLAFIEKTHNIERELDKVTGRTAEAITRTETIFRYIDDLKPLIPKLDSMLAKLDGMNGLIADHEKRIRNVETASGSCDDHRNQTKDQEDRMRKLETKIEQFIGALKIWGPIVSVITILVSVAALVVAIIK